MIEDAMCTPEIVTRDSEFALVTAKGTDPISLNELTAALAYKVDQTTTDLVCCSDVTGRCNGEQIPTTHQYSRHWRKPKSQQTSKAAIISTYGTKIHSPRESRAARATASKAYDGIRTRSRHKPLENTYKVCPLN